MYGLSFCFVMFKSMTGPGMQAPTHVSSGFMFFEPVDDLIDDPFAFREVRAKDRKCMLQPGVAAHMPKKVLDTFVAQFTGEIQCVAFEHICFTGHQIAGGEWYK